MAPAVEAVQVRVVPVLVVDDAATPAGTLGAAAQVPPPPVLLPPPQAGRRNRALITIPRIRKPNSFFRRGRVVVKPIPTRARPTIGSHIAVEASFLGRDPEPEAPVVEMVTVEVLPLAVGVTGFVPVTVQSGVRVPVPPVTAQLRCTDELYPAIDVKVTVDMPLAPGATAGGVVAVMLKFGTDTPRLNEAE